MEEERGPSGLPAFDKAPKEFARTGKLCFERDGHCALIFSSKPVVAFAVETSIAPRTDQQREESDR